MSYHPTAQRSVSLAIFTATNRCGLTTAGKTTKSGYVKQLDKHQRKNIIKQIIYQMLFGHMQGKEKVLFCAEYLNYLHYFPLSYETRVCLQSRLTKYKIYSWTIFLIKQDRYIIFISSRSMHKCFLKLICLVLCTLRCLVDFSA